MRALYNMQFLKYGLDNNTNNNDDTDKNHCVNYQLLSIKCN